MQQTEMGFGYTHLSVHLLHCQEPAGLPLLVTWSGLGGSHTSWMPAGTCLAPTPLKFFSGKKLIVSRLSFFSTPYQTWAATVSQVNAQVWIHYLEVVGPYLDYGTFSDGLSTNFEISVKFTTLCRTGIIVWTSSRCSINKRCTSLMCSV